MKTLEYVKRNWKQVSYVAVVLLLVFFLLSARQRIKRLEQYQQLTCQQLELIGPILQEHENQLKMVATAYVLQQLGESGLDTPAPAGARAVRSQQQPYCPICKGTTIVNDPCQTCGGTGRYKDGTRCNSCRGVGFIPRPCSCRNR